ncbi:MAG TPA: penicillin-binding protein 2 [Candidatus Limnocylindria bacterium]|nr:penicillin-binding protein 2 [Candidatus Limnocylindria bacterium]
MSRYDAREGTYLGGRYLDGRPAPAPSRLRFLAFAVAVVLAASALSARLFAIQVGGSVPYTALAGTTRTVLEALPSTRGVVYDRNGTPLVSNTASYSVKIRPSDLPESRRLEVINTLAALVGADAADITVAIDSNPGSRYDLVRVAQDIPPEVAGFIAESRSDLPGVEVVVETRRNYEKGPLFAHVLGYTGPIDGAELPDLKDDGYLPDDLLGRAGVEASYEQLLRGQYGLQTVERDAAGRPIQVLRTDQPPVAGSSVQLTLDVREQELAEKAMRWGMKAAGLKRGVVIVMNPQNGEIVAMVSLPNYDDNQFSQGISGSAYTDLLNDPEKPLVNHAISDQYPPGSTYKLVAGTGVLDDGKITASTRIRTAGYLSLGGFKFRDWNNAGFGLCNIYCGFGHSSDTFFYQAAAMLGIDRHGYWGKQYGFGSQTEVDLPSEASGVVPTNQWKLDTLGLPIYPGEVYLAGIGQGYVAVTPIQLLNAYCALANGGTLYKPHVVGEVIGPDGTVTPVQPEVLHEMDVDQSSLRIMRRAGRNMVVIRHTYNLVDLPIVVAGKTGTAQFGTPDRRGVLPFHSWFAGFVPKDPYKKASDPNGWKAVQKTDSELAVLVFAYDSGTKGNAATEIAKYYLQLHYDIKKDYRNPYLLKRGNFYNMR